MVKVIGCIRLFCLSVYVCLSACLCVGVFVSDYVWGVSLVCLSTSVCVHECLNMSTQSHQHQQPLKPPLHTATGTIVCWNDAMESATGNVANTSRVGL